MWQERNQNEAGNVATRRKQFLFFRQNPTLTSKRERFETQARMQVTAITQLMELNRFWKVFRSSGI
jgi:hypothetical protein